MRIDAFETSHVEAELAWVRTSSMVRVDTAIATEIVLSHVLAKLIRFQCRLSPYHLQIGRRNSRNDYASSFTERTVATVRIWDAIRQMDLEDDRAAMAACSMIDKDRSFPNLLQHVSLPVWDKDWREVSGTSHFIPKTQSRSMQWFPAISLL